jgi:hypothetical protein
MTTRSSLLFGTCLAAALACAPVAYAEHDDDRWRGPRWSHPKHASTHHHGPRHHGSWCPSSHGHSHVRAYVRAPFFCSPCGHRFGSRRDFHRHIHHHHHVPWAFVPHVIVQVSLGWIFHG